MSIIVDISERHETLIIPMRNSEGNELIYTANIRDYDRATRTPNEMVKFDDVMVSTIDPFTDHAPLVHHWWAVQRETTKDSSTGLKGSGANKLTDIVLVLLNDPYNSTPETNLHLGKQFNEISIKKLAWSGQDKPQIEWECAFGTVRVITLVQGMNYVGIVLRANKYLMTRYSFDQAEGNLKGNAPVSYNYETGQADTGLTAASQPGGGAGAGGGGGEAGAA